MTVFIMVIIIGAIFFLIFKKSLLPVIKALPSIAKNNWLPAIKRLFSEEKLLQDNEPEHQNEPDSYQPYNDATVTRISKSSKPSDEDY